MLNQSQTTIQNDRIQSIQRKIALATVTIPFLGFIVAVITFYYSGISATEIVLLAIMHCLTYIGVTVGFHRYFSHKSFETNTAIKAILAILGSMAAQGPVYYWVAAHRRHHQYSDQSDDPHSPYIHEDEVMKFNGFPGFWHAHAGWMISSKLTNYTLFVKDLLKDPLLVKINQLYLLWVALGLVIPAVLGGVFTLTWIGVAKGFLWGGLVRIFLVQHTYWYNGSLTHILGKSDFDSGDESRNNIWMAIPTFGEAWHNNHHTFPSSAIFGFKWWQIDLGGWLLRILEKLGLVRGIMLPTPQMIAAKSKS
jgi:stearoyl-CoA desaturase (Delta-9 desaturase)